MISNQSFIYFYLSISSDDKSRNIFLFFLLILGSRMYVPHATDDRTELTEVAVFQHTRGGGSNRPPRRPDKKKHRVGPPQPDRSTYGDKRGYIIQSPTLYGYKCIMIEKKTYTHYKYFIHKHIMIYIIWNRYLRRRFCCRQKSN